MIERYSLPEATEIWTDSTRYNLWLKVELAACRAMAELGIMPKDAFERLRKKAVVNVDKINQNEKLVKHDVIAFTMAIEEVVGADAQYFHYGLTSSDVLDTTLSLQLKRAGELILLEVDQLAKALKQFSMEHKDLPAIGRSHGIHAEALSFGQKFLSFYAELIRNKTRLETAMEEISFGMFSGAVGSYGTLAPKIEKMACKYLGLKNEAVSTQVIPRDRYAVFFQALANLGTGVERLAVELRHLQRTEVGEVEEGFSKGQKGSSAMPHKKNPISAENLTGCARLLRSYSSAAIENVALWHERDISHSSVERVIAPDATILCHYMLVRATKLISELVVNENRVHENLQRTNGLIYSGSVLLGLVEKGMNRDQAYRLVQQHALAAWKSQSSLKDLLLKDKEVIKYINKKELEKFFHTKRGLEHVDEIFKEVFTQYPL